MFNQNFGIMNGNYPLGAEYLPNAPFNQPEPIEKDYDVEVTATLSCSTTVTSNDAYYAECGLVATRSLKPNSVNAADL